MESHYHISVLKRHDYAVKENGDSHLPNFDDDDDDEQHNSWTAYKPRTVLTLLLIGACFLIWASGALNPERDGASSDGVKRGTCAMIAVFLAHYCMLQAPSTVLISPHPAIWRLVHGMAVVYLFALTFLLFQSRDDARRFMKFLHPDLGVELPERSYGADCRIYVPENHANKFKNLCETLFDEFVLAHVIGWWGKAILIRNQRLLWVLSIGFELMELTFRHMLPNFNECWWDSIVLDILVCNWFGIWAGMHTVKNFDGKTYKWFGLSDEGQPKTYTGVCHYGVRKILCTNVMSHKSTLFGRFMSAKWDKDEWLQLQGPWRFIQVLGLCIGLLTVELNTFFLKFCLWIPPPNSVVICRLILWWLLAIPAIREYNACLQGEPATKKAHGAYCWLSLAICIVELLICIKFGHGLYPAPMPSWLVIFWSYVGVAIVTFLLVWSWHLRHLGLEKKRSPVAKHYSQ